MITRFAAALFILTTVFFTAACEDPAAPLNAPEEEDTMVQPSPEEMEKTAGELKLVSRGLELHKSMACIACHSLDGKKLAGATYLNLYNSQVELEDGRVVTADEDYLRRSILHPNDEVVKGYPPAMPSYADRLSEEDVDALVALIKSLKDEVEEESSEEETTESAEP